MKRTKCEVYARCVGYIRPIDNFNDAKISEYRDRLCFDIMKLGGKRMEITKESLNRLYNDQCYSLSEIAKKFGTSPQKIMRLYIVTGKQIGRAHV